MFQLNLLLKHGVHTNLKVKQKHKKNEEKYMEKASIKTLNESSNWMNVFIVT